MIITSQSNTCFRDKVAENYLSESPIKTPQTDRRLEKFENNIGKIAQLSFVYNTKLLADKRTRITKLLRNKPSLK